MATIERTILFGACHERPFPIESPKVQRSNPSGTYPVNVPSLPDLSNNIPEKSKSRHKDNFLKAYHDMHHIIHCASDLLALLECVLGPQDFCEVSLVFSPWMS